MKIIGKKCFIIAEAGVNHNGSLDLAKKLVDVAKIAGVDAVKFQTFKAEDVVTKSAGMAEYQKKNTGKNESQLEMIKKFELSYKDFLELKKYCDNKKIVFLSTPHTQDAVDFLDSIMPLYKIGSGDLTNLLFLKKVANKKKLIILSTGMANILEVKKAIETIKNCGNNQIIILHCTTNYPCPAEEVNLKAMITLQKEFNLPVGYSDHTEGILASIMAVSMGACVLEKHFTLDKNLSGPDHKASLNPQELKEMVLAVRSVEKFLGNGVKKPTKSEEKIKKIVRKSIVAKIDIKKGQKISLENIAFKRPGTGISPEFASNIIGKTVKKDIKKEELISWEKVYDK